MKCRLYPSNSLGNYVFADVFASYKGKWIFCKHNERTTWENPGGHIENGETPLEAAKRELFEESGAINFDIEPLCDYWVSGKINGIDMECHGQAFFANVHVLADLPIQSEMEKICLFDSLPNKLTYPDYTYEVFALALKKKNGYGLGEK